MLIAVLAWLALTSVGASLAERLLFAMLVVVVYGASYVALTRRPADVIIGYKG